MDRLSIFDQHDNNEATSGMVFGGGIGDIKKQLDPSFQTVDDVALVLPPGFEHMKVYLRIRPFTKSETHMFENQNCMQVKDDTTVVACAPKDSNNYRTSLHGLTRSVHKFAFSKIFPESTSQAQLFSGTTFPVVKDFVEGHNCLMFTYGVTNSGKTFTVLGTEANPGLVPRALDVVFNSVKHRLCRDASVKPRFYCDATQLSARELIDEMKIKHAVMKAAAEEELELAPGETTNGESTMSEDSLYSTTMADKHEEFPVEPPQIVDVSAQGNVKFSLWVSFLEIYNESAYDLLEHVGKKTAARIPLPLKEDRNGMPYVKGLKEIHVTSAEEAIKLLKIGQRNLQVACTRLNHNSSRSHCIFTVKMLRLVDTDNPHIVRMSMLSFCDLAGSERQSKTQSIGMRMREASNINASLLQLGLCIKTLRHNQRNKERQQVVPYRDSKLTRLFQSFFSGHGTVTMVINVSGCATTFDETLHALKYGALATQIVVGQEVEPARPPPTKLAHESAAAVKDIRRTMQWATPRTMKQLKTESDKATEVPLPEAEDVDSETEVDDEEEEDTDAKIKHLLEENARLVEANAKSTEENKKLWLVIDKLKAKCAEEMKKNMEIEERVRNEVCTTMQRQIIELENTYKDRLAYEHALQEERHEHRLDIMVASIKRTKKRKRVFGDDESEEGGHAEVENISVARQLEEERTLRQDAEEKCAEMSERVGQLEREVDSLQADRNSQLASKTAIGDQLTQAEFQLAAERESMQMKIRELETYIKQLNDAIFIKENALQRSRATVEALESETKSLAETIATSERKVEEKERELYEARESLSVATEAQQRLHDVNVSLSARLEERGFVANDLQAQIQTLKTAAESDAASESARQKELEAELERRTKQLEKDVADAVAEKSRLQEALDAAEAAVNENELAVAQRAGELERLTGELERLTSVVEQERASSSDLRAELEQQRQQFAARNSEADVDAREKQTQLEAKLNSLQEQVIRQAEQLQQETSKIHVANQDKQSLEAALEEKELEIERLRELVREADDRFSRYITPSEKREEEEAESRVRQLAEQVKQQEDALLQASTRADNAEKEKQSLEAALEISEKTSEERECEIEELRDRVRQLDERLASETARLQKVVDEEKATAENLRVQWQQLQSMTQAKESVSSTTDVENRSLSVTSVNSAQGGRTRRQPRKQAAAAVVCDTDPDLVGPSPVAPPSRRRRNRRPKDAVIQADRSMDDDFESDSKLSTKENIDIKSVTGGSALESDSNAETEEPHLVSPPHSPLPKGRPRRHLLKAVQDEQFCASPLATPDDLFKDRASSHDTVLKSLRTRNRKH